MIVTKTVLVSSVVYKILEIMAYEKLHSSCYPNKRCYLKVNSKLKPLVIRHLTTLLIIVEKNNLVI